MDINVRRQHNTHYDTLGVNPSANKNTCAMAFKALVFDIMKDEGWFARSQLGQQQDIDRIAAAVGAITVLGNDSRRTVYNRELRRQGIICDLCDGSGRILNRFDLGPGTACIACGGSGKTKDYVSM